MNITDQFSLDERRSFVMRHTLHMAMLQRPESHDDYRLYVETAPKDWINKTFTQLAELYDNDLEVIRERCASA